MEITIGQIVQYRVRKNPVSAPDKDYVARAEIVEDLGDGYVNLVIFPKRSDPTMLGPIPHVSAADSEQPAVWENAAK